MATTVCKVYHQEVMEYCYSRRAVKPLFPEAYVHVADVATDKPDVAFHLTNNIDNGWHVNSRVTPVGAAVSGARSTSVGDVVVTPNGERWLCAPFGWEKF